MCLLALTSNQGMEKPKHLLPLQLIILEKPMSLQLIILNQHQERPMHLLVYIHSRNGLTKAPPSSSIDNSGETNVPPVNNTQTTAEAAHEPPGPLLMDGNIVPHLATTNDFFSTNSQ